jgi:hypothetical protein
MYGKVLSLGIIDYPQQGKLVKNQKGGDNLVDANNFSEKS